MPSKPSSSKSQGVTKCRYTTSSLSKQARQASNRETMAENENTEAQAEEDHLRMPPRVLMPPPPQPATPRRNPTRESPKKTNGGNTSTMTLRPRKKKNNDKSETVDTAIDTAIKKPDDDTKEQEDDAKKNEDEKEKEDDLPPIEPLTKEERLLFPDWPGPWLFETMTPEEVELWRELEPEAGDHLLTVDEVDELCDDFYKES